MAFAVAILGSVQAVAIAHHAGPPGYVKGLKITLLIAAVLLTMAALASTSLRRGRTGSAGE
jgi:hypothetical protein